VGFRIIQGTVRPPAVTFTFDDAVISAHAGETLAAALLAGGVRAVRRDSRNDPRGPYCNMGACFECMVEVLVPGCARTNGAAASEWRSVRACLTAVSQGLRVRSRAFARTLEPDK
jgi:D-hydroxyproline dehydrogenase subunit gamma